MIGDKILIVDLNSGSYTNDSTGYELFNLDRNSLDGMYYGYVPPKDKIDINKIEKGATKAVRGVLVVYCQAISKKNKNREIIAYCENAIVFALPQPGERTNRHFYDKDGKRKCATYSIKSDNLTDLRLLSSKFTIRIADYNPYMFRMQRCYLEKYPQLKSEITSYILSRKLIDGNEDIEQINIQNSNPASVEASATYSEMPDVKITISGVKQIKKNPAIAKKVLNDNEYRCLCNIRHVTFMTPTGNYYMEGHHLIPCTIENSERFKAVSKLDREENIVCVCPNCHKAIHYGNTNVKTPLIELLYNMQLAKLNLVGLKISVDELLNLYKCNNDR